MSLLLLNSQVFPLAGRDNISFVMNPLNNYVITSDPESSGMIFKTPASVIPVTFDFTEELDAAEYLTGAVILLSVYGMSVSAAITSGKTVTTFSSGGTGGLSTRIKAVATSNLNNVYEHDELFGVDGSPQFGFSKSSSDEYPISVDFSALLDGDSILAQTVVATDSNATDVTGNIIAASGIVFPKVRLIVTGGTPGTNYRISVVITTHRGAAYEAIILLGIY